MRKYILVSIGLALLPVVVHADNFASQKRLDSLFTSPAERQQLDSMRASGAFRKDRVTKAPPNRPVFSVPLKVEMRGVLIKNGKQPVVWVNKGNTLKSAKIEDGVRVRPEQTDEDSKKVPVRIYDRTYRMKPGEVWTEINDMVIDGYQIK